MLADVYRIDGGGPVDPAEARRAWARAARPLFVQIARRYGRLISPAEFGEEVQALAGIRTRAPLTAWVDDVLDDVSRECAERGEPLLSAFCVGADGRMGERYEQLVIALEQRVPADIEMHAAIQRLEAHRYHGAVLPVDGGQPTLPPELAKERAAAPKRTAGARTPSARPKKPPAVRKPKKPELPPRAVCPTCFLQLPATGRCDNCDD